MRPLPVSKSRFWLDAVGLACRWCRLRGRRLYHKGGLQQQRTSANSEVTACSTSAAATLLLASTTGSSWASAGLAVDGRPALQGVFPSDHSARVKLTRGPKEDLHFLTLEPTKTTASWSLQLAPRPAKSTEQTNCTGQPVQEDACRPRRAC